MSVESLDGEVGNWVGGNLGTAVIRCYYNSGVVFWPVWLPYTSVLFDFLCCDVWCGCVLLILWLFCKPRIESASFVRRLGCMRLGTSHNKGAIRQDQVFVYRYSSLHLSWFILSSLQRLEIMCIGQKPVCVGYLRSIWIRGEGFFWVSGGIRALKARRVVILLNSVHFRPVGIFHSCLIFLFLGHLNLFSFFVASLSGASTILAASACLFMGVGLYVQRSCTSQGDIRMELVTMFRTSISSPNFVSILLVPCSDKQSLICWCSFMTVSRVYTESFESDPLGSEGILGIWGWVVMIRRRYVETMLVCLDDWGCLKWYGKNTYNSSVGQNKIKMSKYVCRRFQWMNVKMLIVGWDVIGHILVGRNLIEWSWLVRGNGCSRQKFRCYEETVIKWQGYNGNNVNLLIWKGWGLHSYCFTIVRQIGRIWKSYSRCQYPSLLLWGPGAIWVYRNYNIKRRVQIFQKAGCSSIVTLEVEGIELVLGDRSINLLKFLFLIKQWSICRKNGQWTSIKDGVVCRKSQLWKKGQGSPTANFYAVFCLKSLRLEKNHGSCLIFVWWKNWLVRHIIEVCLKFDWGIKWLVKRVIICQMESPAKAIKKSYAVNWSYKLRDGMKRLLKLILDKVEKYRQIFGLNAVIIMVSRYKFVWIRCFNPGGVVGLACGKRWILVRIIERVACMVFLRVDWTINACINKPIIMRAGAGESFWADKTGYIWLGFFIISGTYELRGTVYWALGKKWKPKGRPGIINWSGKLDWVFVQWAQWALVIFVWTWANIWVMETWADKRGNVVVTKGWAKRKWFNCIMGRKCCVSRIINDQVVWPKLFCSVSLSGLMKIICDEGRFSLSFRLFLVRIWVYVMGLCWPVGFRFGLVICIG
ncbi:hypothetical protein Hanom_Chr01g00000601 [Helianthus anomalus]